MSNTPSSNSGAPYVAHSLLRPRTLYVSDLDGTLLDAQSRVSEASSRMLNEALELGALFTIATARTPATVVELMREVRMRLPGVVMTGAALYDFATGAFSHISPIPADSVRDMLPLYRKHGVSTLIYIINDNLLDVYHLGPLNDFERRFIAERSGSAFKKFHIPDSGESELPADLSRTALMFSVQPWERAFPLYNELKDSHIPCTPLCYHDIFGPEWAELEVFGPHTSKAAAVETIASDTAASRIVAFGDNVNDLPLFDLADEAFAVSNAIPQLKEAATDVIGANTEDAVASFILNHSR